MAAVPLIGPLVTTPPSTRRNSSGDAVTTHTSPGTCTPPAYGAGLPAPSTRAERTRVGLARERGAQDAAEIRLVDVTFLDVRPHAADRVDVPGTVERRRPGRRRPGRSTRRSTTGSRGVRRRANRHARTRALEVADDRPPARLREPLRLCPDVHDLDDAGRLDTGEPRDATATDGLLGHAHTLPSSRPAPRDPRDHPGARSQLDSRGDRRLEFGTHTEHR